MAPLLAEQNREYPQMPLITKQPGGPEHYVPWSFMDMIGLAARLPELTEGANKWILALEESTAGYKLALGDIKALLMHVAGKHVTEDILEAAKMTGVIRGNGADHIPFGRYRAVVWAEVRKQFPEKMDASRLKGEKLKDEECPAKFMRSFQRRWREETGSAWNDNPTTENFFKMMMKEAMPQEVQKRLDNVVGLMKMDWELFSEHVVHHVGQYRKEEKQKEEQTKQMTNKLAQLQLGELTDRKKNKGKIQAPVITTAGPLLTEEPKLPHAASPQAVTPTSSSPPDRSPTQAGQMPQFPVQCPPYQVIVDVRHERQEPYYRVPPQPYPPQHFQGRGRATMRGGSGPMRGMGRGRPPGPYDRPQYSTPETERCFGCQQMGHRIRDCPNHPRQGPAGDAQL